MKETIAVIIVSVLAIFALGLLLTIALYPINILSCNSETSGMKIMNNEYRFWSGACMVQLKDGSWVPLKNYRSFSEEKAL